MTETTAPTATPDATGGTHGVWSQIVAAAKRDPWGALALGGLVASVVFLVLELRYLTTLNNEGGTLLRNAGYGAWTIGLLMLVTFPFRTLRVRHVLRLWLLGFFPVMATILLLVRLTEGFAEGNLRTAFIVPITEELVKLAPLLVIIAATRMQKTTEPAIVDFVIGGFAIGAGFGLHEDGLWVRDIAGGFDGSWWGRIFPNYLNDDPFVVAHPGWTALVGLGIGLCWHFRTARFAWLLGFAPLAVATLDHISINYRGDAGDTMRGLVMDGRLPAWLLIIGFVVAVLIDLDAKKKGMPGLPTRTARECVTRPRMVPAKARVPVAVLLIAQLRTLNGAAFRRARTVRSANTPTAPPVMASPQVTTF